MKYYDGVISYSLLFEKYLQGVQLINQLINSINVYVKNVPKIGSALYYHTQQQGYIYR